MERCVGCVFDAADDDNENATVAGVEFRSKLVDFPKRLIINLGLYSVK